MDNRKAEFAHLIVQSINDLDSVREKVKAHRRASSIYAGMIDGYITAAQNKIEKILTKIDD